MSALTASPRSQSTADTPSLVHARHHRLEVGRWDAGRPVLFLHRPVQSSCCRLRYEPALWGRDSAAHPQMSVDIYSTCTGARQSEEEKDTNVDRHDLERRGCSWSMNVRFNSGLTSHTHTDTHRNVLIRSRQKVPGD